MMKYLLLLVVALFAMAAAQEKVKVVDVNPEQGRWGVNRPSPVHVVDNNNPGNVNVVDNNNPGNVHFVDNNPYYNNDNPGNVHFVDNNNPGNVHVVDNNPYYDNNPGYVHVVDNSNPGPINLHNPDPGFYRPSNPPPGGEPVDISPVFVNPPYPYKQHSNPYARGGK